MTNSETERASMIKYFEEGQGYDWPESNPTIYQHPFEAGWQVRAEIDRKDMEELVNAAIALRDCLRIDTDITYQEACIMLGDALANIGHEKVGE